MKIRKLSQWTPFGGSIRYEGEDNQEYKVRLLKEVDVALKKRRGIDK